MTIPIKMRPRICTSSHFPPGGTGKLRTVTCAAGRLGDETVDLFGNGWRLRRGHVVKPELRGRDPNFLRLTSFTFRVRVSRLRLELPVR